MAVAFRYFGATNVTVLHTYDSTVADTEEFIAPLKDAKAVFFGSRRQWRLVDAYAGTKTEKAFQNVLDAEGVISGSSAEHPSSARFSLAETPQATTSS